ncbi:MAG: Crp/Fnr family transcriptional regulator [Myxococcota bacterium]
MPNLLIHNEFLRVLPESLTRELEARAVKKRYREGDVVFRRGDPGEGFFGVAEGAVQVLGSGADGRELVLTVLGPGEWFGELSLFDGLPRTHDNVAKGDTTLWFVPRRDFFALLDERPEFHRAFLELVSHRVRMLFTFIEDAVLKDLPSRLAKRLLELAGDHGAAGADGGVRIELHLPQEELAAMLGATREAIGRHLKRWERDGHIALAYGRITLLDRAALAALAAG